MSPVHSVEPSPKRLNYYARITHPQTLAPAIVGGRFFGCSDGHKTSRRNGTVLLNINMGI